MELKIDPDLLRMGLFNNFFCIIKRGNADEKLFDGCEGWT